MKLKGIILITLILTSAHNIKADQNAYALSDKELEEITNRAEELNNQTGIKLGIEYGAVDQPSSLVDPSQNSVRIILDFQNKEGKVLSNFNTTLFTNEYFTRLGYLYVKPGFESNTLKKSILLLIDDLERTYKDEETLKKAWPDDGDATVFNREFLHVLYFFIIVLIIYVIKTIHKISRATNKAEYWQYYGYSRMPFIQKAVVSVFVIGFVMVFIFQYVYYYDEIITLYLCLAFIGRPMVLFGSHLFMLVKDKQTAKGIEVKSPEFLSLGQKMYLLKPQLKTEEYVLLDVYELLINHALTVTPELKEPVHLNRYRNFISLNHEKKMDKSSSFQKLILNCFPPDKEQYYLVNRFINKIMEEMLSFKQYKKDFLIKDLVEQGFVTPESWASNSFKLTEAGKGYQRRLNEKIKALRIKFDEYLKGSGVLEIDELNGDILLTTQSEKRIDELYNRLLNDNQLTRGRASKIGVILEPSFSFADYRAALRKQIVDSYESRLGNPSDWTDG